MSVCASPPSAVVTIELEFEGRPAGYASLAAYEDGAAYLWTRPDGESEGRAFATRHEADAALTERLLEWYGGLH